MATATETTKRKTVRINGCVAAAQAAKYADVDVITAYPIRPYTATMMALAQMVANGELDAEYIVADSEHSQLSIAHGAASSGARVFTGSSGVGVQFAYELYSPISGSRMPVQMMIADRTLDPPGDFGSEHTDALSTRDMGWIMGWSCDAQEAFDNHLMAYRIGEDRRVLLPQMVCQDGFFVSHITTDVELPDPGQVKEFLPPYKHPYPLDPRRPVSHGPQIMPEQGRRCSWSVRAPWKDACRLSRKFTKSSRASSAAATMRGLRNTKPKMPKSFSSSRAATPSPRVSPSTTCGRKA